MLKPALPSINVSPLKYHIKAKLRIHLMDDYATILTHQNDGSFVIGEFTVNSSLHCVGQKCFVCSLWACFWTWGMSVTFCKWIQISCLVFVCCWIRIAWCGGDGDPFSRFCVCVRTGQEVFSARTIPQTKSPKATRRQSPPRMSLTPQVRTRLFVSSWKTSK